MSNLRWITPVALALVILVGASAAEAGTLKIAYSSMSSPGFAGGEFVVWDITGAKIGTASDATWIDGVGNVNGVQDEYQTFCLEKGTSVVGDTFTLDDKAITGNGAAAMYAGDVAGVNNTSDPISEATKWLYLEFWNGTLFDYEFDETLNGGLDRQFSAKALQWAIWYLEDETNAVLANWKGNSNAVFAQAWEYVDEAIKAAQGGSLIKQVRVLNITNDQDEKQSQLIVVPLPASAFMGLGLLCALGAYRTIRRKKQVA